MVSPRSFSETAKCLSMLTSQLAVGQDSQLCQIQPPHPTLTQLGSPFSTRSFPTLFPLTNNSNPRLPSLARVRVSSEVLWLVLEIKRLHEITCETTPLSCFSGRCFFRPGPPPHGQRLVKRDIMQHAHSVLNFQNNCPLLYRFDIKLLLRKGSHIIHVMYKKVIFGVLYEFIFCHG